MTRENIRELLVRLHDIILAERQHATNLDIQAMYKDIEEKEKIIRVLSSIDSLLPEDKHHVERIRTENRRNAYLFRSTLNFIRDTMTFFGVKSVPETYGKSGNTMASTTNGKLLSGKV
ncbi:MAG: flagellar protein FlgN [Desulfobulbaceae bacterium]|nr:flagellar protein FlgN [Desulfobulbaceae bacterium]